MCRDLKIIKKVSMIKDRDSDDQTAKYSSHGLGAKPKEPVYIQGKDWTDW